MIGANEETRFILKAAYDTLTEQLKARAKELGKEKEFAEADGITTLLFETKHLRADLEAATGEGFFDILDDPARQNELALLRTPIAAGGLPDDYLDRTKRSMKATHRFLKSAQAGDRIRLKDAFLAWIEIQIEAETA